MKQKLIFLDIDGTLLPPGEMLIPQSTVEALHKAHANGHKLFLCTGRNLRMTQPLLDYGFDGAVCSAGGYVFCGDKVLVDLCPWSRSWHRACAAPWSATAWSARWKRGMPPTAA